ncbi:MAG: glycerate kinase, partial [Acidimicrobiales bacterium]
VACDVRTRFVDAAAVFGPQKGASPAQVEFLRRRLERLVQDYLSERGVDVSDLEGAGAAGGLAGGLASVGAELADGFDIVADACGLDELVAAADLVLTGEGAIDPTSFDGKVVGGVEGMCADAGVPMVVVAGRVSPGFEPEVPFVSLVETVGLEREMLEPINGVMAATVRALDLAPTLSPPEAR